MMQPCTFCIMAGEMPSFHDNIFGPFHNNTVKVIRKSQKQTAFLKGIFYLSFKAFQRENG